MAERQYRIAVEDVFDLTATDAVAIIGQHLGDEILTGDTAVLVSTQGVEVIVPHLSVPFICRRVPLDGPSSEVSVWLHGVERAVVNVGDTLVGPRA